MHHACLSLVFPVPCRILLTHQSWLLPSLLLPSVFFLPPLSSLCSLALSFSSFSGHLAHPPHDHREAQRGEEGILKRSPKKSKRKSSGACLVLLCYLLCSALTYYLLRLLYELCLGMSILSKRYLMFVMAVVFVCSCKKLPISWLFVFYCIHHR